MKLQTLTYPEASRQYLKLESSMPQFLIMDREGKKYPIFRCW